MPQCVAALTGAIRDLGPGPQRGGGARGSEGGAKVCVPRSPRHGEEKNRGRRYDGYLPSTLPRGVARERGHGLGLGLMLAGFSGARA